MSSPAAAASASASVSTPTPSSSSADGPRYPFDQGTGIPLGQLPCFLTVGRRSSAAAVALEAALEPLHRLVFGRPGVAGERRPALEPFQGLPAEAAPIVQERMGNLKKEKLRTIIQGLGIRQKVSSRVEDLAKGVADFIMCPRDDGVIKLPQTGSAATPSRGGTTTSKKVSQGGRKREREAERSPAKADGAARTSTQSGGAVPLDTVKVAVFERVLKMSPAERDSLGAKALRTEVEAQLQLPEGGLKHMKEAIASTAALTVSALLAAEERAAAAAIRATADQPLSTSSPSAPQMPAE